MQPYIYLPSRFEKTHISILDFFSLIGLSHCYNWTCTTFVSKASQELKQVVPSRAFFIPQKSYKDCLRYT